MPVTSVLGLIPWLLHKFKRQEEKSLIEKSTNLSRNSPLIPSSIGWPTLALKLGNFGAPLVNTFNPFLANVS